MSASRAPGARSRLLCRLTCRRRTPTRSSTTTKAASTATSRASARVMPPSAACWWARRRAPSPTMIPRRRCSTPAARPAPNFAGPFGTYFTDTNQIPNSASCAALTNPSIVAATGSTTSTTTGVGAAALSTNITNACLGNAAFFNAGQDLMPTFVARLRVDQPWGHLQWGLSTVGFTLNDGRFLTKSYLGYGGAVSGHFFTWGKDSIGGGLAGGDGLGDQVANNVGVATNFGGALGSGPGGAFAATDSRSNFSTSRAVYDAAVLAKTITSFSARIYYEHWWTDQLRSDVDFSMNHNDVPAFIGAGGRALVNKELSLTHINLIWSPVAFVDIGIEGAWGHRQVVSNLRGDAYTVQSSMKVRF